MKRAISFICIFLLLLSLVGCKKEDNQHRLDNATNFEYQLKDEDENNRYTSKIKTTNSKNSILFEVTGNKITVSGTVEEGTYGYLLVLFNKNNTDEESMRVENGVFCGTFELPDENDVLVELYGCKEEYGNYESIILDYIKVEKNGDVWQFVESPVLQNNEDIFNAEKNSAEYLSATERIQSGDSEIVELSNNITHGINDDYEKAKAIHDWVAENIYYDYDALVSGDYSGMDAKNVLLTKKGVCEGYANILAALLRSQDIPCRVQGGYALGVGTNKEWDSANISTKEGNHAWNEVYINGEWIIIDATWDSKNRFEDGEYMTGESISDIYFDTTMEFLSLSHKLIEE